MAREPAEVIELRVALGRRLSTFRNAKRPRVRQEDLARATNFSRTKITHLESGSARAGENFWTKADEVLGAGGVLLTGFREIEAVKRRHTQQQLDSELAQLDVQIDRYRQRAWLGAPNILASAVTGDIEFDFRGAAREALVDPMRRRTLMKWGLASTAAIGLPVSDMMKIEKRHITRIERTAARLHHLDQEHGGDTLWQAAIVGAEQAYHWLDYGTYSEDVGDQLLKATARMQICAGWLAFDAGEQEIARSSYEKALTLARQAGDVEVETRAHANLAFQSNLSGNPAEALRFARAAERSASLFRGSSRITAIPQLRLAIAGSLRQDASETSLAITRARKALEKDKPDDTPKWCAFLDSTEIDGVEATCAVTLGQARRAEALLERATESYGDEYARNRALYRVRLARARIENGAIDGAAEAANAALDDLANEVCSWRINSELDEVASSLTGHARVAGVDRFLNRHATGTR